MDEDRHSKMTEQPLVATRWLGIVAIVGILAIVAIRVETAEVPVGLVGLTSAAVTGLAMASGRRRV